MRLTGNPCQPMSAIPIFTGNLPERGWDFVGLIGTNCDWKWWNSVTNGMNCD